jgi:hypothetical protein
MNSEQSTADGGRQTAGSASSVPGPPSAVPRPPGPARNCILEEIAPAGDGLRRHRCLVCGRQAASRYPADQVHLMCIGTPEQYAAWRSVAVQHFLDALCELADFGRAGGPLTGAAALRSYEEMEALYAQCQRCPDWQVTLCRRLRCPGRPQKYLRLLADSAQRCPNWTAAAVRICFGLEI